MTTKEMAQAVIDAVSACEELKTAAKNYIDAIGTEAETEAGRMLVDEAEEDISSIDNTIAFFESDMA
ncbi:MAG: molecular chaperone Hsp90, partial [Eubacterium sp.]|nr:molecular chaperone Hsp90 [Eubacterium sp.]